MLEILGTIPKLHTNIVLPIILAGYITYSLALKLILFLTVALSYFQYGEFRK